MNERPPPSKLSQVIGMLVFLVVITTAVLFLVGPTREWIFNLFRSEDDKKERLLVELQTKNPAEFFRARDSHTGLRFTAEALVGLGVEPVPARRPTQARALPPQIGTTQYDNDRLFIIRSRFPGEVAWLKEFPDTDTPFTPTTTRPLRYGDSVKQSDKLMVVWSQQLGQAKANLVDAVSNLRLSSKTLDDHNSLFAKALALAQLRASQRQEQLDRNALHTAERSLRTWKLTKPEIDEIKTEAEKIAVEREKGRIRDLDDEMKWAWVEIFAPKFNHDPKRALVVVEKNTHLNDMLDPIASPPMLKLADLSRLTLWVQPHEEYLPLLRERLEKKIPVRWQIRFPSDPPETKPLDLDVVQIAPSIDPTMHTPMVFGYLPNEERKYFIGQFVTATIYVDPDPDTVEIPTDALNEGEGQSLVFVQTDAKKREFMARRVAVVHRFKDVSVVRSKLTEQELNYSVVERAKGRRPLEPLLPGEAVVTQGVMEMTVCLDTLSVKDQIEKGGAK